MSNREVILDAKALGPRTADFEGWEALQGSANPFGFTSIAFAGLAYHPRAHRNRGCRKMR